MEGIMRITKADAKRYIKENSFSFVANGTLIINDDSRELEWQE
jgi:hypothetical protein